MKNWYTITNKANGPAEISIFGPIGNTWDGEGVTAAKFIKDFRAIKADDVTLTINSPGGSLFDGLAIYTALAASGKNITAKVMGLAASAASVILMAASASRCPRTRTRWPTRPPAASVRHGRRDARDGRCG
jgi:ATP-dependent Clp protease protease subunit